jgi:predicted nucleic acid-binding protein
MAGTRSFVDTNVLVYAVDDADPVKRDIARDIVARAEELQLVLSTQVLSEFYVVVTRKLARPMSEEAAGAAVDALAKLPVVVTDIELVRHGIALSRDNRVSFWDGLIAAAAHAAGCESILTEDLQRGAVIAGATVSNPFLS